MKKIRALKKILKLFPFPFYKPPVVAQCNKIVSKINFKLVLESRRFFINGGGQNKPERHQKKHPYQRAQ